MAQRRKIEDLFQRYFRRNVLATSALLLCCAAIFFIALWGHEVLESKRNAESFVRTNQDRLLRLALDKNYEAINLYLAQANAQTEKMSYRLEFKAQSRAIPLTMGGDTLGYVVWNLEPLSLFNPGSLLEFVGFFLSLLLLIVFFHFSTKKYVKQHLVAPLEVISSITRRASRLEELTTLQTVKSEIYEIERIRKTIWGSARRMQRTEARLRKAHIFSALEDISALFTHNIGSPLAMLSRILDSPQLPKEEKEAAHTEIKNIRHVINQVLEKYKAARNGEITTSFDAQRSVEFLPVLIEAVVEKKRWELQKRPSLNLKLSWGPNLQNAFGAINAFEFQRLLSNLINNAADAIKDRGEIEITITSLGPDIQIGIRDTGVGIPQELLAVLGTKGATFGKVGVGRGVGLGVYHAKETLLRWDGTLNYESIAPHGTQTTIRLPMCQVPLWHPESIVLTPSAPLILIDDDSSQSAIWNDLIRESLPNHPGVARQFTSPEKFKEWFLATPETSNFTFLVDFEFGGSSENGLDLIQQFQLERQAFLITGLASDKRVRQRCEELGVALLLKGSQKFVPFESLNAGGM